MFAPRLVLAVLAALGASAAQSATVCVTNGNQLASALQTAETNGQDDEIRVVVGTMQRTGVFSQAAAWTYDPVDTAEDLVLSGGWSAADNCQTQSLDATDTQLDGRHASGTLEIFLQGSGSAGNVTVSNLMLARGKPLTSGNPSHVFLRLEAGSLGSIVFERNVVVSGLSTIPGSAAISVQALGGAIRLRSNVISFNTQIGPAVRMIATSPGLVYFNNNTVFSNTSNVTGYSPAGVEVSGAVSLANNALYGNVVAGFGNVFFDLFNVTSNTSILRNNHIGVMEGQPAAESDTTTGDPKWDIVGMYPRPLAVSPLRDSGRNSPLGGLSVKDTAGDPRVVAGTVDRGALEAEAVAPPPPEEAVFANGFE